MKKKTNKLMDEAAAKAKELEKQSKLVEDAMAKLKDRSITTNTSHSHSVGPAYAHTHNWHSTYPVSPSTYPVYPSQNIQPYQSVTLPHYNLGSEEENSELLAMMDALGVEPTENYLVGLMLVIGEKYYSLTDLLVKQMQFMIRINILLCHRSSDDEN